MSIHAGMEVFRDFTLKAERSLQERLRDLVAAKLPPTTWHRDLVKEERWPTILGGTDDVAGVYVRWGDGVIPEASVFLLGTNEEMTIPNIVPTKNGELSVKRYNKIFDEFIELGVRPAAEELGLVFSTTAPLRQITDWLSSDAQMRLRQFSAAANKANAASHPLDRRRWLAFLIAAFEGRCPVDTEFLRRWLVEAEDWPTEIADDLVRDYEFSSELLQAYVNRE